MYVLSRLYQTTNNQLYNARLASEGSQTAMHPREMYHILRSYYKNNGLYDELMLAAYQSNVWQEGMKPLRNPAGRVVEFYAAKLWPGMLPAALPIVTDNEAIIPAVEQIWKWSNFNNRKTILARWLAIYGNVFVKVVNSEDGKRVYFQLIDASYVGNNFEVDERGFITYLRLDMPKTRRGGDVVEAYTHTEVWDAEGLRIWEHTQGVNASFEQLGTPTMEMALSDFQIDFIPFVHFKFRDLGEHLGVGSFTLQLDKIDEANRQATRLHQMLFRYNKNHWALRANAMDSTGRPLPPPSIGNVSNSTTDTGDKVTLNGDELWRLPGQSSLESMVPPINYADALTILNAHLMEVERDLPELAYSRLREMDQVSGIAVRTLLSDAIDRVIDARTNAEEALARANMMALTIGQNVGLFEGLGAFEAGDFEHSFREREVIPLTPIEKAELVELDVKAGIPLVTALRWRGRSEAEIAQMVEDKAQESSETQANLAQALLTAQRRQDQGA